MLRWSGDFNDRCGYAYGKVVLLFHKISQIITIMDWIFPKSVWL
jgi:hypothetical protein